MRYQSFPIYPTPRHTKGQFFLFDPLSHTIPHHVRIVCYLHALFCTMKLIIEPFISFGNVHNLIPRGAKNISNTKLLLN